MEFSPHNPIVKLCLQGMSLAEAGKPEAAGRLCMQAWSEATDDFEKFLAAYYVAQQQTVVTEKLHWFETALQCALKSNNLSAHSAWPTLYTNIAQCYKEIGDTAKANQNYTLVASSISKELDPGPFYHGTKADLHVGDLLTAGGNSNYQAKLKMNHIYFTALVNGAGLAAALSKGDGPDRVYMVEPTGNFENDPNVTDKKFPGNLTRSYRSVSPLKIIGEVTDWTKQTPEQLDHWRNRLAKTTGEIIN